MTAAGSVPGDAVPQFPRGVRLAHDAPRDRWVLLAPERVLEPDEIAVEILRRVDGMRTVDEVVDLLAADFQAERGEVAGDVREFLSELVAMRVLVL